jgi:hypothetical protein
MSGIAPIPDEPLRCSEPPLWANNRLMHRSSVNLQLFNVSNALSSARGHAW